MENIPCHTSIIQSIDWLIDWLFAIKLFLFAFPYAFEIADWILEFRSGASLFGSKYRVHTNHPLEHGIGFRRSDFHHIEWQKAAGSADETAFFAPVKLRQAGAFEYYYEEEDTYVL